MGRRSKGKGKKSSADQYRELLALHMTARPSASAAGTSLGDAGRVSKRAAAESSQHQQRLRTAHGRLESMSGMFPRRGAAQAVTFPFTFRKYSSQCIPNSNSSSLITGSDTSMRDCVAVDCEMVGTGTKGSVSMLGRCSIVNHHGHVLYDTYVAPLAPVTDYRTYFSGIRSHNLVGAPPFHVVQSRVKDIFKGRVIVGHDLRHDLLVLDIVHPLGAIRDTCRYSFNPFQKNTNGKHSKLKTLVQNLNGTTIQRGEHCSVEDAQAAMVLYQSAKVEWESLLHEQEV